MKSKMDQRSESRFSTGVPVSTIQHHDGNSFVEGKGGDYNSFMFFSDPDGNGWAIQESPLLRQAATETTAGAGVG